MQALETQIKPYYEESGIAIYNADCREVLPLLPKVDLVLTDPPYGIGKAEWDNEFPLWWLDDAACIAETIAFTPGNWNLLKCPNTFSDFQYKWTLSAHLVNGMTKGGFGWGNWIPCVVYRRVRRDQPEHVQAWCRSFAAWCGNNGIGKRDLDRICGTSDMGGWYLGLLPHRCQIPARHQWEKIKQALNPPDHLQAQWIESDFTPASDCRDIVVGHDDKPNHPCPKPLTAVRWFLSVIDGDAILDPFMGSGTTLRAAKDLGRKAIGIEIEERYCEIAANRLRQEVLQF